ncbi:MAG: HAD family hydrolase [Clostridiales bacterium]|nr:HAD family hydrolase [Clostridiales bacterium]
MADRDLSNWLVVSDIDGTLNNKLRRLPKRNYDAICRFVKECKGHFTLASGRNVQSLRIHYDKLPIDNTPAVILNGAGVYDYSKEKMIRFSPINPDAMDIVRKVYDRFPSVEIEILTDKTIYTLNSKIFCPVMVRADRLNHTDYKRYEQIPKENWGKVIFLGTPSLIKLVRKFIDELPDKHANFMSSSVASFEMLEEGIHKGVGAMEIADMFGVDQKHTAAIGDYFNDYDMLKTVYLSACCGQAPQGLKEICKYHACHCNKGAVGDLLEYIMDRYEGE